MSTRYPGGFINRSAPVIVGPTNGEGGSAPGVWTLEQASYYTKQGTWPQRVKDRPLYSWGSSNNGELGLNNVNEVSSPTQVGALKNWSSVASGAVGMHCLVLNTSGNLWSFGKNQNGQLGQNNLIYRSSPVQVGALTTWLNLSTGTYFSFATKTDGTLWSWGSNAFGQLGQNDTVTRSSPVQVGSNTSWSKVYCGSYHSLAIKTDGTLWSCGLNVYGELGQNNTTSQSSPIQVGSLTTWLSAAGSNYVSGAIKTDGTLWAWGQNQYGQLGQSNTINRSSPVQVGALTTWSKIDVGLSFVTALKSDGTLWSWGYNAAGNLGNNTAYSVNKSSPTQIGSLATWSNFACRRVGVIALKSDGTMWGWGQNTAGAVGDNTTTNRSSPVQIGSVTSWGSVYGKYASSYAIQVI